jgi:hypothetical protein
MKLEPGKIFLKEAMSPLFFLGFLLLLRRFLGFLYVLSSFAAHLNLPKYLKSRLTGNRHVDKAADYHYAAQHQQ